MGAWDSVTGLHKRSFYLLVLEGVYIIVIDFFRPDWCVTIFYVMVAPAEAPMLTTTVAVCYGEKGSLLGNQGPNHRLLTHVAGPSLR